MKKLLWVGDAGVPSGFARATHEILDVLRKTYDITVLGMSYRGDPHDYPYPIYAAMAGGDQMGLGRLIWMCDTVKPDVIVLQNDPWNIPAYIQLLADFPEHANIPVVACVAVDGKNVPTRSMNGLAHAIFWTQFGLDEARIGGYNGPASVIPLGVDLNVYFPLDKKEARQRRTSSDFYQDKFIVGNVNRNQPRKRWDLTIKYFAQWVEWMHVEDAFLYLHVAPTGDKGVNVQQLCKYYGILERLMLVEPHVFYGIAEHEMRDTCNCFDVSINTGQGEGFGLTTIEAMACGVPCIAPDWSGLGDWAKDAIELIPCTSTAVGPPYINVIGGIPDQAMFMAALDKVYRDHSHRATLRKLGLRRAAEMRFNWKHIGERYVEEIGRVLQPSESLTEA